MIQNNLSYFLIFSQQYLMNRQQLIMKNIFKDNISISQTFLSLKLKNQHQQILKHLLIPILCFQIVQNSSKTREKSQIAVRPICVQVERVIELYNHKLLKMDQSNFQQFLETLNEKRIYLEALKAGTKNYKITQFKITNYSPQEIDFLFKRSLRIGRKKQNEQSNYSWAQGELKIFVWLIVCYSFIQKVHISQFRKQDFHFFCSIFKSHSADFIAYQIKFLLKTSNKASWTSQEVQLLNTIINQKLKKKNWNTVAFQLFLQSEKQFFRTPKQCRERWYNHEDPSINRQKWTHEEDALLMNLVITEGKKWSLVARQMNLTRTEHMVKNRYTSEIKKLSNIYPKLSQKILRQMLANREPSYQKQSQSDEEFRPYEKFPRDSQYFSEKFKVKWIKSCKKQQSLPQNKIQVKQQKQQDGEYQQKQPSHNQNLKQQLIQEQQRQNISFQEISFVQKQQNYDPFDFFGNDFATKNSLSFFC